MGEKIRFTDRTINSLPVGSYIDTLLPAFCIRVGKRRKTFYTVRRGHVTTIGHYPSMSLHDARNRARLVLADPDSIQQTTTLLEAIEAYLRTRDYRPGPLKEAERLLKKHLAKFLSKDIRSITTRDLSNLMDELRTTPSEANHLYGVSRTFFRWASQRGYCTNPLTFPKPYKEKSRARVLTDDEIVKVWKATDAQTVFNAIIRLCLLTGQRRGELSKVKREWIRDDCLVIPADVAKNGKEHSIPLLPCSKNLVTQLVTTSTNSLRDFNTWSKPKAALDKASGVSEWVIHDLRRTAASKMAQLGIAPHVIEKLLNHSAPASLGGAIGNIYNRYDFQKEMKEALLLWENHLTSLVSSVPD